MVQGRSSPVIPTSRVAHRSTKVLTILPSYVVGGRNPLAGRSQPMGPSRGGRFVAGRVGTVASSDPRAGVNSG